MKIFAALLTCFVSITAQAIVGGIEVTQTDSISHSVVELIVSQPAAITSRCSGTLVSEHVVLTAAHCLKQIDGKLLIGFGLSKRGLSEPFLRTVGSIEIYPSYKTNAPIFEDDIGDLALIHFDGEKPAGFRPATLISATAKIASRDSIFIAGFGSNTFNGNVGAGGGILRTAQTVVENVDLSPEEMLIGDDRVRTCFGDSGGASYFERDGEIILNGVVMGHIAFTPSPTGGCIGRSKFTKVQAFAAWISQTIAKLESAGH